jgi:hypothetical protein
VRKRRREVSPELEEILKRALAMEPRNRYQTASEMAWELEHPEMVGVEDAARHTVVGGFKLPGGRKLALYAGLVLAPILIFGLMMVMARR